MAISPSINQLIEERIGLTNKSRNDFEAILDELSAGDRDTYLKLLHSKSDSSEEWQRLIRKLSIGETYFFRDRSHFHLMRNHILPSLIAERRKKNEKIINIWSVGCATGEEPYSIAILIHQLLADRADWTVRITGSDLNQHALDVARTAVYRRWSFRQHNLDLSPYFIEYENQFELKPFIRDMVKFRQGNLLHAVPVPQFDLVLCRNVLLYFSDEQTRIAEQRLQDVLYPGGWMFLGQSEVLTYKRDGWLTHLFPGAPVYQKDQAIKQTHIHHKRVPRHPDVKTGPLPDTSGDNEYDLALRARSEKRPEEAIALLMQLVAKQPNNAAAHTLLASVYADQKQFEPAFKHIEHALHIEPLMADAFYLRGLLHFERSEIASAKKALHHALYCQTNHPLASFMLGIIHAQSGEFPRAIRLWENARKVITSFAPDSPLSDMSGITADRLNQLIEQQLEGWS